MAWALDLQEGTQGNLLQPYNIPTNCDIEIDMILNSDLDSVGFILDGYIGGNAGRFYFGVSSSGTSLFIRVGSSSTTYTWGLTVGERTTIKLEIRGNSWEMLKDGVSGGILSTSNTPLPITNIGSEVNFNIDLSVISLSFIDIDGVLEPVTFNASLSDHSNTGTQPRLINTSDATGLSDIIGSGLSTDGSAWVDLGGGGGNDVILDVDNGAFSLSGSDVLFMASRIEQALTGNYNLSGSDINFSIGYAINLDGGIYSLSGSATGLVLNANTVIESGEYSLAGTQANLDIARKSIIESGSYNLTGSDVTLIYTPGGTGESLFIDSGAFSLTGSDIGLKSTRLISVNSGIYNLTGQQISLTYNAKTIIDSGSYALIGSNVNLFANRVIIAVNGSYTLSGTSVILKYSGDTYKTIGTVTAGFAQDRYSAEYKPTTITVNFKD